MLIRLQRDLGRRHVEHPPQQLPQPPPADDGSPPDRWEPPSGPLPFLCGQQLLQLATHLICGGKR